jgi:hypothetical protein
MQHRDKSTNRWFGQYKNHHIAQYCEVHSAGVKATLTSPLVPPVHEFSQNASDQHTQHCALNVNHALCSHRSCNTEWACTTAPVNRRHLWSTCKQQHFPATICPTRSLLPLTPEAQQTSTVSNVQKKARAPEHQISRTNCMPISMYAALCSAASSAATPWNPKTHNTHSPPSIHAAARRIPPHAAATSKH